MMKKFLATAILACVVSLGGYASNSEETFDRGVGKMNSVFIPKGYIGGGLSFSYKTYEFGQSPDDVGYSMLFSLLSGIKAEAYTLGVSPTVSYFIMDNFSVGGRFDYNRTLLDLDNLGLSIGDLASFEISDYHFLRNAYSFVLPIFSFHVNFFLMIFRSIFYAVILRMLRICLACNIF